MDQVVIAKLSVNNSEFSTYMLRKNGRDYNILLIEYNEIQNLRWS